ncbi:MAG: hypothetical protein U0264_09100 [Candidatus Kapaibacterium sp.]
MIKPPAKIIKNQRYQRAIENAEKSAKIIKNQRYQRAIENAEKSAKIIKNQRHLRAIEKNKQSTTNANGTTCGILCYRFESGRVSSFQLTRHVAQMVRAKSISLPFCRG